MVTAKFMEYRWICWLLFWLPLPCLAVLLFRSSCRDKRKLLQILFLSALVFCSLTLGRRIWELDMLNIILMFLIPIIQALIILILAWRSFKERWVAMAILLFSFLIVIWIRYMLDGIFDVVGIVTTGVYFLCGKYLAEERKRRGESVVLPWISVGFGILTLMLMLVFFFLQRQANEMAEEYAEEYVQEAMVSFEKEDYEGAVKNFSKAVQGNGNLSYLSDYAIALVRNGEDKKAEEILEQFLEKEAINGEEWLKKAVNRIRAEIHFVRGQYEEMIEEMPSLVVLQKADSTEYLGVGVIVKHTYRQFFIVTSALESTSKVNVRFNNGEQQESSSVVTDSVANIAVISVLQEDISEETKDEIRYIACGVSDDLQEGDSVIAIGNPVQSDEPVVAIGKIDELEDTWIRTDIAAFSKENRGVFLNKQGELVGIINGYDDGAVSVPIDYAWEIIDTKILEIIVNFRQNEKQ
ncbi:MAG: trypsin-like peptidase domain-containing protein [Clostridiales bacterium]|nr:trypsin-like peptidase domain-containing protein [Clostridiales bacterium]